MSIHLPSSTVYQLIGDVDGFIHSIGHVIRLMPELEELQVTRKCGAKLACKLLLDLTLNTSADENSNLCPRLHTIHLYSEKGIDKHVFLEFIKSRRPMLVLNQHVNPLRNVKLITETQEFDKAFLAELEVLRDERIDINIVIG
jgi:hypothetical protein